MRRTSPWRVLAVMAVAGVAIGVASTHLPGAGPAGPPVASSSPEPRASLGHGSIVFTTIASTGGGRQVLWRFDLASYLASQGPQIAPALELVDATEVGRGWLGLTATLLGQQQAFLLNGTSAFADPVRIGSGDLVAWGPGATSVAFSSQGAPDARGCRELTIDVTNVLTNITEPVLEEPRVCGRIVSLGRSGLATYFTQASAERIGIYFTGVVGVPHLVLQDYGMLSISPASDFLVVHEDTPSIRWSPDLPNGRDRTAVLFWQGHGGPVVLGSANGDLSVEQVLAWSPDGAMAAVLGHLDGRDGIYVLDAGPGVVRRMPTFIVSRGKNIGATFDDEGTLYLVIGGHLFSYAGGVLSDVLLPEGSPAPRGPIVWMP